MMNYMTDLILLSKRILFKICFHLGTRICISLIKTFLNIQLAEWNTFFNII